MTHYTEDGLYESSRPRFSETVDNTVGEALVIYPNGVDISVIVDPGSNTGRVEKTLSSLADVEAGTATWYPWDSGDVTAVTETVFAPGITALRLVASGGPVSWYVCQ